MLVEVLGGHGLQPSRAVSIGNCRGNVRAPRGLIAVWIVVQCACPSVAHHDRAAYLENLGFERRAARRTGTATWSLCGMGALFSGVASKAPRHLFALSSPCRAVAGKFFNRCRVDDESLSCHVAFWPVRAVMSRSERTNDII